MIGSFNNPAWPISRRTVLRQLAGGALLAATSSLSRVRSTFAAESAPLPNEPMISVWEHSAKVDIAPTVKEVGFNTVWTHDKPYSGQKLEES